MSSEINLLKDDIYYTNNIETFVIKTNIYVQLQIIPPSLFSNYRYSYKDHEIFYNDTIKQKIFSTNVKK